MTDAATDSTSDLQRRINLYLALLDAEGKEFPTSWLAANVEGYRHKGRDAARKQLGRDLKILAKAGVPITRVGGSGENSYRLRPEEQRYQDVELDAEEAAVVALAGRLAGTGQLAGFARSGWRKLAAAGAGVDPGAALEARAHNAGDFARLGRRDLDIVLRAIRGGRRLNFDYHQDPVGEPQPRVMDPWRVAIHERRLYLVGFDVDREAPRAFRLVRTSGFRDAGVPAEHPHRGEDIGEIVRGTRRLGRELVDARVRVAAGAAHELRRSAAEAPPENETGMVRLVDVDRDWLVRTCAGLGADAVLEEPIDARGDVVALLERQLAAAKEVLHG